MASNLVALSVSDVNTEAAALLAARLALLKAAAMEQPTNAVEDAKRAFLKNLIAAASISGSPDAAADKLAEKLFAEWSKVSAERRKLEERTAAIEDIGEVLDHRWDELAAGQPSGMLESYLKKYKAALEERRSDYVTASNLITAELEWSNEKLDAIQEPATSKSTAAARAARKAAHKK
jgi:NAD-dependent DNA ligase